MFPLRSELPGIIQIEVTSRCNLSCPACPRSVPELKSKWIGEELPMELFKKVVAETAVIGRSYHLQGWGEPLLRRDLPDLVRMISERGAKASITTNGTLLTRALALQLIEAGLASITFSL
ncbi:MAG: radical SAM protein, partial [Candidatus Hydrogenedentota bacterium]